MQLWSGFAVQWNPAIRCQHENSANNDRCLILISNLLNHIYGTPVLIFYRNKAQIKLPPEFLGTSIEFSSKERQACPRYLSKYALASLSQPKTRLRTPENSLQSTDKLQLTGFPGNYCTDYFFIAYIEIIRENYIRIYNDPRKRQISLPIWSLNRAQGRFSKGPLQK